MTEQEAIEELKYDCEQRGWQRTYQVRYPYHRLVPIEVFREPVGREIAE